ncbi:hypothetical protein EDD86DRAFT_205399, partial [Gorgonomyces haynaldii]
MVDLLLFLTTCLLIYLLTPATWKSYRCHSRFKRLRVHSLKLLPSVSLPKLPKKSCLTSCLQMCDLSHWFSLSKMTICLKMLKMSIQRAPWLVNNSTRHQNTKTRLL